MRRDNNGNSPAFPLPHAINGVLHGGMSLREYFAARAMQGLLSSFSSAEMVEEFAKDAALRGVTGGEYLAAGAVKQADWLLSELSKPVGEGRE